MKHRAGFLKAVCVWMVILMQSSARTSCRPRELTALTKSLVIASLTSFDEANGNHLGTWSPGFPELEVQHNATAQGSAVQCSLLFMARGLKEVLEDQKSNVNPTDVSLHAKLKDTISQVNLLKACMGATLGGKCSPEPSPPSMPTHVFARKQWSHTLLKTARDYLDWLQHKVGLRISAQHNTTNARHVRYLEGSGYLL